MTKKHNPTAGTEASGTQRTYRVRFVEWVLYEAYVDATSDEDAKDQVDQMLDCAGTDGMALRANGYDEWEAEPVED